MSEKFGEETETSESKESSKEQRLEAYLINEDVCKEASKIAREARDAGSEPQKLVENLAQKIGFRPVIEFLEKNLVGIKATKESKKIHLLIPRAVYFGGLFSNAFGRAIIAEDGQKQITSYPLNERIEFTLQPAEISFISEGEFKQKRGEVEKQAAAGIDEQYATPDSRERIAREILQEWGYSYKDDGTLYHSERKEDLDEAESRSLESNTDEVWVPSKIRELKDAKVKEALREFKREYIITPEGDYYHIDKVGIVEQDIPPRR